MYDELTLRRHIAGDFEDLNRQLVYADFLEEHGQIEFARYVRLWVTIDESQSDLAQCRSLHESRRRLLDKHPACWQWDNFLMLRHTAKFVAALKDQLGVDAAGRLTRASEDSVRELEEMLGVSLPLGYREYVMNVSDGISLLPPGAREASLDPVLSVREITELLRDDPEYLQRAQMAHTLTWDELMGVNDPEHPVRPKGDGWDYDGSGDTRLREYNGMLPIRWFQYTDGGVYLALHGELRGVAFSCSEGYCNYWAMGNWDDFTSSFAEWHLELKRIECGGSVPVRQIPLDTFTVMQLEVLSHWNDR